MAVRKIKGSLKKTIRFNALSCLGFGLAFALIPQPIATFLDGVPLNILRLAGIGLVLNGMHLMIASLRRSGIGRIELGYFILGDSLWVMGSLVLITFVPQAINSPLAIASTLVVAVLVGSFAILQTRLGWKILKPSPS